MELRNAHAREGRGDSRFGETQSGGFEALDVRMACKLRISLFVVLGAPGRLEARLQKKRLEGLSLSFFLSLTKQSACLAVVLSTASALCARQ
jgi:hypothetical protein